MRIDSSVFPGKAAAVRQCRRMSHSPGRRIQSRRYLSPPSFLFLLMRDPQTNHARCSNAMLIFILCRDIRGLSTVTDIDIRHTYVGLKTGQASRWKKQDCNEDGLEL